MNKYRLIAAVFSVVLLATAATPAKPTQHDLRVLREIWLEGGYAVVGYMPLSTTTIRAITRVYEERNGQYDLILEKTSALPLESSDAASAAQAVVLDAVNHKLLIAEPISAAGFSKVLRVQNASVTSALIGIRESFGKNQSEPESPRGTVSGFDILTVGPTGGGQTSIMDALDAYGLTDVEKLNVLSAIQRRQTSGVDAAVARLLSRSGTSVSFGDKPASLLKVTGVSNAMTPSEIADDVSRLMGSAAGNRVRVVVGGMVAARETMVRDLRRLIKEGADDDAIRRINVYASWINNMVYQESVQASTVYSSGQRLLSQVLIDLLADESQWISSIGSGLAGFRLQVSDEEIRQEGGGTEENILSELIRQAEESGDVLVDWRQAAAPSTPDQVVAQGEVFIDPEPVKRVFHDHASRSLSSGRQVDASSVPDQSAAQRAKVFSFEKEAELRLSTIREYAHSFQNARLKGAAYYFYGFLAKATLRGIPVENVERRRVEVQTFMSNYYDKSRLTVIDDLQRSMRNPEARVRLITQEVARTTTSLSREVVFERYRGDFEDMGIQDPANLDKAATVDVEAYAKNREKRLHDVFDFVKSNIFTTFSTSQDAADRIQMARYMQVVQQDGGVVGAEASEVLATFLTDREKRFLQNEETIRSVREISSEIMGRQPAENPNLRVTQRDIELIMDDSTRPVATRLRDLHNLQNLSESALRYLQERMPGFLLSAEQQLRNDNILIAVTPISSDEMRLLYGSLAASTLRKVGVGEKGGNCALHSDLPEVTHDPKVMAQFEEEWSAFKKDNPTREDKLSWLSAQLGRYSTCAVVISRIHNLILDLEGQTTKSVIAVRSFSRATPTGGTTTVGSHWRRISGQ